MRRSDTQKKFDTLKATAERVLRSVKSHKNSEELLNLMNVTIYEKREFNLLPKRDQEVLKAYIEGLIGLKCNLEIDALEVIEEEKKD